MKKVVWKAYMDYEKEEQYINEMSAKGWSLVGYTWCRYVFEETNHDRYSYRIELLDHVHSHPESVKYIKFLEENGIECVATYMRWIYLKKNKEEGEFNLYSDVESKIQYYRKILTFWRTLMFLELGIGFFNISIGLGVNSALNSVNIIGGVLLLVISVLFLKLSLSVKKKINELSKERLIRE